MPRKLDTYEFPHGGRKGMDFNFEELCDGSIWQLEKGVDWDAGEETPRSAESFLGALSRYANEKGMRVNKDIASSNQDEVDASEADPKVKKADKVKPLNDIVTVRVRPKKEKSNGNTPDNEPATEEATVTA